MGQSEVYQWLVERRLNDDNRFFSPKEIGIGLKEQGMSNSQLRHIQRQCLQMESFGFFEGEVRKDTWNWRRCFRLKEEYIIKKKLKVLSSAEKIKKQFK